jgi:CubicO group peptidase (beta-lactamase class C family)
VCESHILHSLSVGFGSGDTAFFAYEQADETALYDLASLTKLFTLIALMKLNEAGRIDFGAPLRHYDKRFTHIGHLPLHDIMAYRSAIVSSSRIDEAPNRDEALKLLFASRSVAHTSRRFYSDMHAMVLKYAVEGASGMPFHAFLHQTVFRPAGMKRTYAGIPCRELHTVQSYDREHRITNHRYILRSCAPGTPHDPKAALLSSADDLCGHAGLFSSLHDMTLLCQAILSGALLSPASLRSAAQNRTGKEISPGVYTQHLGYLCFVKHPHQFDSETPEYMTASAFGLSGFTGNHISLDPQLGVYHIFLGNRCLNRLTVLVPDTPEALAYYGLRPDGSGECRWSDGRTVTSSVGYVHQKDRLLHRPILEELQRAGILKENAEGRIYRARGEVM